MNASISPNETEISKTRSPRGHKGFRTLLGIIFTVAIALLGILLAQIPGLSKVGPLACAIVIAVLYRQIFDYPTAIRNGIQFSSTYLLRTAIVLYGLRLNLSILWSQGLFLLMRDVGTVAIALIVTAALSRLFKADRQLTFLLAVGTAICGAAAIAAIAPIVRAKEKDTALGVGLIALVGTLFALFYVVLRPILPLSTSAYGIWAGVSLHEIAQVALAAAPAGTKPLDLALLAKLGRVFLLIPFSLVLVLLMRRNANEGNKIKIPFPWFLVGFLLTSAIGTMAVDAKWNWLTLLFPSLQWIGSFLLAAAMVGLGLNVRLLDLRTSWRPVLVLISASIILSGVTFFTVL